MYSLRADPREQHNLASRQSTRVAAMLQVLRQRHADLLIESHMPSCLVTFCAHVASYKIVLDNWDQSDYSEHTPVVDFPKDLPDYARKSFDTLKAEQARLLGKALR